MEKFSSEWPSFWEERRGAGVWRRLSLDLKKDFVPLKGLLTGGPRFLSG